MPAGDDAISFRLRNLYFATTALCPPHPSAPKHPSSPPPPGKALRPYLFTHPLEAVTKGMLRLWFCALITSTICWNVPLFGCGFDFGLRF